MKEIVSFLDSVLMEEPWKDFGVNGLQVNATCLESAPSWMSRDLRQSQNRPTKVAFAVDCGLQIIEEAIFHKATLLVVHHGILWGEKSRTIDGAFGHAIALLLRHGCSLYASHLPLDGHPTYGNATQMAQFLDMEEIKPAFLYEGKMIGCGGRFGQPKSIDEIKERCQTIEGCKEILNLPFGKQTITTVGIATGSGAPLVPKATQYGFDLFIPGEPR